MSYELILSFNLYFIENMMQVYSKISTWVFFTQITFFKFIILTQKFNLDSMCKSIQMQIISKCIFVVVFYKYSGTYFFSIQLDKTTLKYQLEKTRQLQVFNQKISLMLPYFRLFGRTTQLLNLSISVMLYGQILPSIFFFLRFKFL